MIPHYKFCGRPRPILVVNVINVVIVAIFVIVANVVIVVNVAIVMIFEIVVNVAIVINVVIVAIVVNVAIVMSAVIFEIVVNVEYVVKCCKCCKIWFVVHVCGPNMVFHTLVKKRLLLHSFHYQKEILESYLCMAMTEQNRTDDEVYS